ncbi:unnamed protein product [Protopolystoma xenopodis]|uniref:G-protein coupled receptors family 1 profile domain-containing protein n=1 Tax=Protopolystoma xenopodis TaxID=117903 RepID=A0A3S5C079_9PLAT|nr:unnamed protein product [Protopolystoma xenopodis]
MMVLLAIGDTSVILTAVTRYWTRLVFDTDIRHLHWLWCKVHFFLVAFASDYAQGMLCSVAVERFLLVAFPQRASQLVTNFTDDKDYASLTYQSKLNKTNSATNYSPSHQNSRHSDTTACGCASGEHLHDKPKVKQSSHTIADRHFERSPASKHEVTKRNPENLIKILTVLTVVHVITTMPGTTINNNKSESACNIKNLESFEQIDIIQFAFG